MKLLWHYLKENKMKKIELEELKQIELDMMQEIDNVCQSNGIHYYMVGGTLLGAVRHNGFIPWDDDIDIAMPRKDFERFCVAMKEKKNYYEVQFYNNVNDYGYASPKVVDKRTVLVDYKLGMGKEESSVFVDVFLYDGMGENLKEAYMRYFFLKIFKKMVFLSKRNFKMENTLKSILFFLPCVVCKLIGVKRLNILYNTLCKKYDFYTSKYVACVAGRYGKREVFKREVFENTVPMAFENLMIQAPQGYKTYLALIYGNYMDLPPKDKQVSNHTSEEWWRD